MPISRIPGVGLDTGSSGVAPSNLSTGAPSWDTSGNLSFNSGYGSNGVAYACRAWVNFNGTGTVAIRASGNVSSITDNGTGDYTVSFTTAMVDANYACAVTNNRLAGTTNAGSGTRDGGLTTGGARVVVNNWASPFSAQDVAEVFVAIFR